jgi:hypothetical protein
VPVILPDLDAVRRDVLPALAAQIYAAQRAEDTMRAAALQGLHARIVKQEPDTFTKHPGPQTEWTVGLVVQRVVWGSVVYTITVTAIEPAVRERPSGRIWTQRAVAWGV